MRMRDFLILILLFFGLVQDIRAQRSISSIAQSIDSLSIEALQENNETESIIQEIDKLFLMASIMDEFGDYPFSELRAILLTESPDKNVRIFSGLTRSADKVNSYFGGVFHRKSATWFPLTYIEGMSFKNFEQEFSDNSVWYGAVYYDIYPFRHKGRDKYILFGMHSLDQYESMKLADVLHFDEDRLVFGAPVFLHSKSKSTKNRFSVRYAAEAPIKLNFDPVENKIVFDHVIPMKSLYQSNRTVMVPDGSYSGYSLEKGVWIFVEKLATEILDSPPRPNPVLDERKNTDIFGRTSPKNGKPEHPTPSKKGP
jgi:hypothetical protein